MDKNPSLRTFQAQQGTSSHILGADHSGRDVLSRLLHGARVSLTVMVIALVSGGIIGTTMGVLSGYYGGVAG